MSHQLKRETCNARKWETAQIDTQSLADETYALENAGRMLVVFALASALTPGFRSGVSRRALLAAPLVGLAPRGIASEPPIIAAAAEEPEAARRLLALCEGKRPSGWKADERPEIDALIEEVVALRAPWPKDSLRGKWKLAYLQPGPDGGGVDRRIPFPELPGNDSFQIFGEASVTNVGELLGPALEVRVSGSLSEADPSVVRAPKRFRADIDKGEICATALSLCAPLPIKGEGIFDGVYLGKRMRIGQNLNGGGARIVQVRVDA